ncbi:MAG: 4-(cytidine 5'-diphospho)-2-C-methyl-D-erythritol kinase [Candidatus Acidiferrales bacterium]
MKNSVRLPAFAKVNLCLHVLGRRPDGYHELRTIFQAISLHDTLEITRTRRRGITLEIDDPSLPVGRENLVYRAIEAARRELDFRGGIHARLEKLIPAARGLGGGSSDAATALIAMLHLTGHKLPLERLIEIAAGLGADVPFFLFGGRSLGVNRGDEIYPLPDGRKYWTVVVSPSGIAVSTRDAFQWVSLELTKRKSPRKIFSFCALCWSRQDSALENDFEAPVFRRHPRLGEIHRGLLQRGAARAALAGSGSAVFGLFRSPAQARRAAVSFPGDQVFMVETLAREEYVRALRSPVSA